jgi:hypothetical protein
MHFSVADLMQTFHTANISDTTGIFSSGYRDIPPSNSFSIGGGIRILNLAFESLAVRCFALLVIAPLSISKFSSTIQLYLAMYMYIRRSLGLYRLCLGKTSMERY